jgi:hypothetical protein
MKENNEDENQKILNFMEISKINDRELAKKYLLSSNYNETQALNKYFSINENQNNFINDKELNQNNLIGNNIKQNKKIDKSSNNEENEGFINRYIISPIMSIFGSCIRSTDSDLEDDSIFYFLPNTILDFSKFNQCIKKRLGIIIIYEKNHLDFLRVFINKICRNSSLMDILKKNCIIFPILSSSSNGYRIQNILDLDTSSPSIIFCFNNSNENIFEKDNIIEQIQGTSININNFYNVLMNSLTKINKEKNAINENLNKYSYLNNDINILTDGEILQRQKDDMEKLEKDAQDMEEEIKLKKNKKREQFEKIEKKAEILKKKFEKEPEEDNPDVCVISFRYPDGDKRKERRFLKNNKIKDLYDYIESLGNEIYTEDGNGVFSLYQPFPPKKYENMENTLEKEGLFPNALIQIKEE